MNEIIFTIIRLLELHEMSDSLMYSEFSKKIDFEIDVKYMEFISLYNGAEGMIGTDRFISLWKIADVVALNPYYADVKECYDLFFFGSDGANFGYAFSKRNGKIVGIDFLEISSSTPAEIAGSFDDFIIKMNTH